MWTYTSGGGSTCGGGAGNALSHCWPHVAAPSVLLNAPSSMVMLESLQEYAFIPVIQVFSRGVALGAAPLPSCVCNVVLSCACGALKQKRNHGIAI